MANYPKPSKGTRHTAGTGFRPGVCRALREQRQAEAKVRQEWYSTQPPAALLQRLDTRLGAGKGAVHERLKLHLRQKGDPAAAAPAKSPKTPAPAQPAAREKAPQGKKARKAAQAAAKA